MDADAPHSFVSPIGLPVRPEPGWAPPSLPCVCGAALEKKQGGSGALLAPGLELSSSQSRHDQQMRSPVIPSGAGHLLGIVDLANCGPSTGDRSFRRH